MRMQQACEVDCAEKNSVRNVIRMAGFLAFSRRQAPRFERGPRPEWVAYPLGSSRPEPQSPAAEGQQFAGKRAQPSPL
eukprot:1530490-Lingulodinium_polyedra.AAC.1